jgi:hypothetical protein
LTEGLDLLDVVGAAESTGPSFSPLCLASKEVALTWGMSFSMILLLFCMNIYTKAIILSFLEVATATYFCENRSNFSFWVRNRAKERYLMKYFERLMKE